MVKRVKLDFFPQERIDLDREIQNHPDLIEILKDQDANEFELRVAVIAMYCDVILHGDYLPTDLTHLCGKLRNILVGKRTGILIVN